MSGTANRVMRVAGLTAAIVLFASAMLVAQNIKPANPAAASKAQAQKNRQPFVGPPAPGKTNKARPAAKKPGNTIPKPTVQLKPGEKPEIKFDTPTYDFGRVRAGQDIHHDFWFTNTGTGPLEILRVKPS